MVQKMVAMLLIATICVNAYDEMLIDEVQVHASEVVTTFFGNSNDMDHEEQEESYDDTAHKTRRTKSICDRIIQNTQAPSIVANDEHSKGLPATPSHANRALRTLLCTYRI